MTTMQMLVLMAKKMLPRLMTLRMTEWALEVAGAEEAAMGKGGYEGQRREGRGGRRTARLLQRLRGDTRVEE